jgi:hypothetical protein
MIQSQLTHSNIRMKWMPYKVWKSSLGTVLYRNIIVADAIRQEQALDAGRSNDTLISTLGDLSICDVLKDLYGEFTLIEKARIYNSLKLLGEEYLLDFFSTFNVHESENIKILFEQIIKWPEEFQYWCHEKDIGARDVDPLKTYLTHSFPNIDKQLIAFALQNPNKNNGVRILELLTEILMMGKSYSLHSISDNKNSNVSQVWLDELKAIRYPMSTEMERTERQNLKSLSWPSGIKAQLVRQGDEIQYDVNFNYRNSEEFRNKINGLLNVAEQMKSQLL